LAAFWNFLLSPTMATLITLLAVAIGDLLGLQELHKVRHVAHPHSLNLADRLRRRYG
jgi:hypothetical protein